MKSVPTFEKPIYENLNQIRQSLSLLKNNRNKYISSKQVYTIYDEFLASLHELSLTRKDEELKGITLISPNGTDIIIDDIWSMLSLCFVTCGLTKFAPATYLSLSTVYKLLGHLKSCKVYTMDDLEPIKERLQEIKEIISQSEQKDKEDEEDSESLGISHKAEESLLLRNKWNNCLQLLNELEDNFKQLPQDLEPIYLKLATIRKGLLNYLTNGAAETLGVSGVPAYTKNTSVSPSQLQANVLDLKKQLNKIEEVRDAEGKFPSSAPDYIQEKSSMILNGLLDDCNNFINDLSILQETPDISNLFKNLSIKQKDEEGHGNESGIVKEFTKLYSQLVDIRLKLENLIVTRRWTMRETDLYSFSKALKAIDEERMTKLSEYQQDTPGVQHDSVNLKKLHMLVVYLLRRNYSLIYKLLESSEPVSESLQPIHNQLSTVRRCLLEIKRIDGLNKLKELYPYQFKLASLDNLREDGKFIVNGTIPEGQGLLNALLAECFDILDELKIELEEKEENNPDNEDEGNLVDDITDEEDIRTDDEVEVKRNRFMGFSEADYDQDSESCVSLDISDSEYEGNDYY